MPDLRAFLFEFDSKVGDAGRVMRLYPNPLSLDMLADMLADMFALCFFHVAPHGSNDSQQASKDERD